MHREGLVRVGREDLGNQRGDHEMTDLEQYSRASNKLLDLSDDLCSYGNLVQSVQRYLTNGGLLYKDLIDVLKIHPLDHDHDHDSLSLQQLVQSPIALRSLHLELKKGKGGHSNLNRRGGYRGLIFGKIFGEGGQFELSMSEQFDVDFVEFERIPQIKRKEQGTSQRDIEIFRETSDSGSYCFFGKLKQLIQNALTRRMSPIKTINSEGHASLLNWP